MQISRAYASAGCLVLAMFAGCQNAGSDLGFGASQGGGVFVGVYLDRDGSLTKSNTIDTVFAHARVALLARGTTDTIRVVVSDAQGVAQFDGVPVGEYTVAIDPLSIGDSLLVAAIDPADITLTAGGNDPVVVARLAYPELTIQQARALPLGRRAFIRAIVLVGVGAFGDLTTHVSDNVRQLRLTRVQLRGGLVNNNPGDSVTVLGTTSSLDGQPTLDLAVITRLGTRPPLAPVPLTTAAAATANGGVLDAGLVQIIAALVSDSMTVSPDFHVIASDNSGPITIILDANLPFARTVYRPLRSITVTGVLVPNGSGGWYLKPRSTADIVFNN